MGMSDQDIGKKEVERSALDYFIDAYEWVTGEQLTELGPAECPDFNCARPTKEKVGVELVRVMRDPEEAQFDRIVDKKFQAEPQETLDRIFGLVDDTNNTILVLQLLDCSILSLQPFLTNDMKDDFAGYGFV